MRCDFQKSECHFQSRSCSLYSFKGTDKILKGREVLTVTNVHMPYVGGGAKTIIALSWCVCVFVFTWQEGPANTISSSGKDSRHSGFWNLGVLSYYLFPNTLKHTGNFGHGLHTRLPFFMINRITLFSSSSEKHWYVCSLCPALSSKINISLVIPA